MACEDRREYALEMGAEYVESIARVQAECDAALLRVDALEKLLRAARPHMSTWNVGSWGAADLIAQIDDFLGQR
ncbi:MAG TPA: hypothetical protein VMN56_01370 [Casimicrobiaceae bacterium]|nr:hypothetical protein [Casimicrobiaceae bacterium]